MTINLTAKEIQELKKDAEWAISGNGPGYMLAIDVKDLCDVIDFLRNSNIEIIKELYGNN